MRFHPPHSMIEMAVILGGVEQQQKPLSSFQIGKFPMEIIQKFPREPPHILHNHIYTPKNESQPVAKGGFPNYFGMQRFGTGHEPSSVMGRALLQGQVKELAMMALGARARHGKSLEAKWWGPQSEGGEESWLGVGWMLSFSVGVDIYFWTSYAHEVYTSEFKALGKKMVGRKTINSFWNGKIFRGELLNFQGVDVVFWNIRRELGAWWSLARKKTCEKTMPLVYISPKGGMTENPDSVKDDLNWKIPKPSPGVLSFESIKPAICSPRNGWIITDRIDNMTRLRNECTWQFTSSFSAHRLEPLGMASCDFVRQAFQEASLGRYASALDMIPPSCLQERAVAWSCSFSWC